MEEQHIEVTIGPSFEGTDDEWNEQFANELHAENDEETDDEWNEQFANELHAENDEETDDEWNEQFANELQAKNDDETCDLRGMNDAWEMTNEQVLCMLGWYTSPRILRIKDLLATTCTCPTSNTHELCNACSEYPDIANKIHRKSYGM
jgi:hypothetical protein